jgi:hypothetical protein
MSVTNLFFKVELEHDDDENPERVAGEIRRQLLRFYGVRDVELSNLTTIEESSLE